jgi:hypothetical protein
MSALCPASVNSLSYKYLTSSFTLIQTKKNNSSTIWFYWQTTVTYNKRFISIQIKTQKGHTVEPEMYECDATIEFQLDKVTTMG